MTNIKTNNFNFQGVGVVVSTNVFVPPPPSFDVPRLIVEIDPDTNAPQVLIENVLSNEPTRIEYNITVNIQDQYGSVQPFTYNQSSNYNTLIFDPVTNTAELIDFSFLIGPIMNAAGRLDDANDVVDLITCQNKKKKDNNIGYSSSFRKSRLRCSKNLL